MKKTWKKKFFFFGLERGVSEREWNEKNILKKKKTKKQMYSIGLTYVVFFTVYVYLFLLVSTLLLYLYCNCYYYYYYYCWIEWIENVRPNWTPIHQYNEPPPTHSRWYVEQQITNRLISSPAKQIPYHLHLLLSHPLSPIIFVFIWRALLN